MTEADVIKPVVRWAKKRGVKHIRITLLPGAERGWPDHCFLIPGGAPVFIEFKRPGKEPSLIQQLRLDYLTNNGYAAYWFDNAEEAVAALERHRAEGLDSIR